MSDQPVTLAVLTTALAEFHREIFLPDMHRVVEDLFERRMKPRFDAIDRHSRLNSLEAQVRALETRLDR